MLSVVALRYALRDSILLSAVAGRLDDEECVAFLRVVVGPDAYAALCLCCAPPPSRQGASLAELRAAAEGCDCLLGAAYSALPFLAHFAQVGVCDPVLGAATAAAASAMQAAGEDSSAVATLASLGADALQPRHAGSTGSPHPACVSSPHNSREGAVLAPAGADVPAYAAFTHSHFLVAIVLCMEAAPVR